jgi:hypothetical protein
VVSSDDIERLLREVESTSARPSEPQSPTPERRQERSPAKPSATSSSASGRVAFAVVSAGVLGGLSWLFGVLMPFIGAFSAGVGGALSAFLVALVAGPPRWFSD